MIKIKTNKIDPNYMNLLFATRAVQTDKNNKIRNGKYKANNYSLTLQC